MPVNNVRNKIWCPLCKKYEEMARVGPAAKLVGLNSRTVYRYIEWELVYSVMVACKTLRVCKGCLRKATAEESRGVTVEGGKAWCTRCKEEVELLSISTAAQLGGVSKTTMYRYVREEAITSIKSIGEGIQVCASCLIRDKADC